MWHVTFDTWHMTYDIWHATHEGRVIFSEKFGSLAHMFKEWRCLEDLEEKDKSVNDLMTNVFVEQAQLHRVC